MSKEIDDDTFAYDGEHAGSIGTHQSISGFGLGATDLIMENLDEDVTPEDRNRIKWHIETLVSWCRHFNRKSKTLEHNAKALDAEIDEAMSAVNACLTMANGRETEWGERAVSALGFLRELCIKRQERRENS